MTAIPSKVRIVEVGARDGLQNEKAIVPTPVKIELIDRLSDTGLQTIEATSFVSPKWVPQLADAVEVYSAIRRKPGVRYPVLVPNLQGYARARSVGATEIAVFTAASEAFNRKNINASIDESIERFVPVMERAQADGVAVRGYVSTVLGCPYQGDVAIADVVRVARRLHDLGCYEISLGDTIGIGTPGNARAMLAAVAGEVPMSALAVHFHDTRGQALANILACVRTRPAQAATWRPRTSSTCCTAWASPPASISSASSIPAAGSAHNSGATTAARSARPPPDLARPDKRQDCHEDTKITKRSQQPE